MKKEFTRIVLFVLLLGICVTTIMPIQPIEAKSKLSKKAKKAYEMILSNPGCIDDIMVEYGGGAWFNGSAEQYGKYAYYDIDNDGCTELLILLPCDMYGHDCFSVVYDFNEKKGETTYGRFEGEIIKVSKKGFILKDNIKLGYLSLDFLSDIDCDFGYYYGVYMGLNLKCECSEYSKYNDGETVVVYRECSEYSDSGDGEWKAISEQKYDKAVKEMKFKTPKWKSISSFKR